MHGLEEGKAAMTDEEEGGVGVRSRSRNSRLESESVPKKQTYCKRREEHDATHMPFRDRCTHCKMGGGRTHHHVSWKRSEDLSRRPITAMDYSSLKPNSIANFQTIPDEPVTGIAVKEDRRQNIMSSAVFEEGNRRTLGK